MTVSDVGFIYDSSYTERTVNNDLGKDDFLNLLVTQLRYQDPLDPVSNEDYIAQLAQFSSLEQMQNMAGTLEGSQSFAMIGKQIYAESQEGASITQVSGVVQQVQKISGEYYLLVDTGYEYSGKLTADVFDSLLTGSDISGQTVLNELISKGFLNSDGSVTDAFSADYVMNLSDELMGQETTIREILAQAQSEAGGSITVTVAVGDVLNVSDVETTADESTDESDSEVVS